MNIGNTIKRTGFLRYEPLMISDILYDFLPLNLKLHYVLPYEGTGTGTGSKHDPVFPVSISKM